jgi:hypothetical protein
VVPISVTAPSVVDGEQYVWLGWTGTGTISYTGTNNPDSVTMNSPITETAAWRHEYRLTMVTNFGTTSPSVGNHWYEAGTVVPIQAFAPSVVDGEQYVWLGWTGTGTISYTGMNNPASVTMNSPITETAAWRHEYRLTMAGNYGTTSPSLGDHWYEAGSIVSISATPPSTIDGERYVWNGWTGTGTISYTGTANSASVTMNSPISQTASWTHQYHLTMATNFGTTDPSVGEHWYDAGSVVSIGATAPSVVDGEQYVWLGWTGTGTISYTGMNNLASVTMNSPISETASWTHQFLLTIKTSGLPSAYPTKVYLAGSQVGTASDSSSYTKWFDAGTFTGTIGVDNTISGVAGTRYVFVKWVEDSSTSNPRASEAMNSPKTFTANYNTQYQITVTASPSGALGGTFRVTYTQYGTTYSSVQEITPWTEWVDAGTTVTVSEPMDPKDVSLDTRCKFDHYDPSSSVTMDQVKSITLVYKTQYLVSFTQTGSAVAPTVTYTADTDPTGTVPFSVWVKAGSQITYEYQSIVSGPLGTRYVLIDTTPSSSQTVNGPLTITGTYKTQYQLTVHTTGLFVSTNVYNNTSVLGTAHDASPYVGWFDASSPIQLDIDSPITVDLTQYVFVNWSGDASGSTRPLSLTMNTPKDITANYKTLYKITFDQIGVDSDFNEIVVNIDGTNYIRSALPVSFWWTHNSIHSFAFQSPLVVTANVKRYVWTSTSGLSSLQSDPITVTIGGPVTGNYKTQYLLTVLTDPAGLSPQPTRNPSGEAGPANGWWYDASTSVTLTAQSVTSYPFNRWDVDGSLKTIGENPISVSMNTRHTATAHYTQVITYTLAITATASGTTNPALGTYTYSSGITVDVTATPSAGYRFDHWVLNGSNAGSTSPISLLMDRHRSLQAVFAETHTLTISVSEGGTTNPAPGTYTYQTPTDVPVTATPNVGYRLDHWIYDNNNIGSQNPITVHAGSSHTLKAVFVYSSPIAVGGPVFPIEHAVLPNARNAFSPILVLGITLVAFGFALIAAKKKRKK